MSINITDHNLPLDGLPHGYSHQDHWMRLPDRYIHAEKSLVEKVVGVLSQNDKYKYANIHRH